MSRSRPPSRIHAARRRARVVKVAAAGAAAGGFAVLSILVRDAHHGAAAVTGRLDVSARIDDEATRGDSFFGSGSVGPASGPSQTSTHTS